MPDAIDPRVARVLILGGGAGGLELAVRLAKGGGRRGWLDVTLVDARLTHVWKPSLHEVAAGTMHAPDGEVDYVQQARRHGFRFQLGRVTGIERAQRQVWLEALEDEYGRLVAPRRAVRYDVLVVALGSVVNDFGTPGVQAHAVRRDGPEDAQRFHRLLLAGLGRSELCNAPPPAVVIVGGGATGVELATELVESVREMAGYGTRLATTTGPVQIALVEAGPRLLAALPEAMATEVRRQLVDRGIQVHTGRPVIEVRAADVVLDGGEVLPASITVWAAGIRGPEVLQAADGLALNRQGQLLVEPTLRSTLDERVFALGDCAAVADGAGTPALPPRAQAAHQEAQFLAQVLPRYARALSQGERPPPLPVFRFRDQGVLVTLGSRDAVGRVRLGGRRSLALQGLLARWTYWVLQRRHMVLLHGLGPTLLATLGGWLARPSQPRVKLH